MVAHFTLQCPLNRGQHKPPSFGLPAMRRRDVIVATHGGRAKADYLMRSCMSPWR